MSQTALIIEDNELEAEFLALYLKDCGIADAVRTDNLTEALAVLSTRIFAVVLLDLKLPSSPPEKTLSVLPQIVARANGAGIVICSGHTTDALAGAMCYAHGVIRKPFTREIVVDAVQTVLVSIESRRTGKLPERKKKA